MTDEDIKREWKVVESVLDYFQARRLREENERLRAER